MPLIGSDGLGYEWLVALLSKPQVNVIELSSNLTLLPFFQPWLVIVQVRTPVAGSYSAVSIVSESINVLG